MKSKTILYVEDNEDHVFILQLTLKKIGIPVHIEWLNNGQDAMDYLNCKGKYSQRQDTPPDLILIDLKMAGIDGCSLIKTIKTDERLRLIPVIVLSSSEDPGDIEAAYHNYANSYIPKSIDASMFRKQIETLVYYWININCPPSRKENKGENNLGDR